MPEEKKTPARPRAADSNNKILKLITKGVEKTLRETAVDPDSMSGPWNTDDLYRKYYDYSAYDEMMLDDQVSTAMQVKKDLIVGSGWDIEAQEDEQDEICRDIDTALREDCCGSFEDCLLEIMTAYEYGFSVTEKQFMLKEDGRLTLKNLKTRHPISWLFHQDKFGNITRYEQQGTAKGFENIDPNALIHFINNPKFGNPYGHSDLRSIYAAWFIKREILKYYAIFMEKAASPVPWGKYDDHVDDADVDKTYKLLKKFQTTSALMTPKGLDLEFLEASNDGEVFIKGINLFNMLIGRGLLVPDLLGYQGGEISGGSYALGEKQLMVFFLHIFRRRRTIENTVNDHIIKPIVQWNYGEIEQYPKFKFKPIDEAKALENVKLFFELVKGVGYTANLEDINMVKRLIQFPEVTEEEWQQIQDEKAKKQELELEAMELANNCLKNPQEKPGKQDAGREKGKEKPKQKFKRIHGKTDFDVLAKELDDNITAFMNDITPMVDQVFQGFSQDLKNMKFDDPKNVLNVYAFGSNDLMEYVNKTFYGAFERAKGLAHAELGVEKFAIQPTPEFLATLEAENLEFIGNWQYNITKGAKTAIIAAIKNGDPIEKVIDLLTAEGKKDSLVALERYARTKYTEVMNKGRLAYFESTGVVAAYQYSAILDGRTTAYCKGLHGKIFTKDNLPPIPGHFGCRSLLVPITQFEDFELSDKVGRTPIAEFIEKNKGKGF